MLNGKATPPGFSEEHVCKFHTTNSEKALSIITIIYADITEREARLGAKHEKKKNNNNNTLLQKQTRLPSNLLIFSPWL
jgi:hypothetical protein